MIIINAGMPKSATTLLFKYQNDLIQNFYLKNGFEELLKYSYGGYIEVINDKIAEKLCEIEQNFGTFVVKTHTEPTEAIKNLISSGRAKATFSFRDPRDIILSAMDHGRRTRNKTDLKGAFAAVNNFGDGFIFTGIYIKTYEAWLEFDNSFFVRYEELMSDKLSVIRRMLSFFEIQLEDSILNKIYFENELAYKYSLNYNKATVGRWKTELTPDQIKLCNSIWEKPLLEMGYSLE